MVKKVSAIFLAVLLCVAAAAAAYADDIAASAPAVLPDGTIYTGGSDMPDYVGGSESSGSYVDDGSVPEDLIQVNEDPPTDTIQYDLVASTAGNVQLTEIF